MNPQELLKDFEQVCRASEDLAVAERRYEQAWAALIRKALLGMCPDDTAQPDSPESQPSDKSPEQEAAQ